MATQFYLQTSHTCLYSSAAKHHRRLACANFTVPRRVEHWVDLGGWLHTEIKCRPRESNLDTVSHPSTNRAQCRLTSLIETNALPLRQTATAPKEPHSSCGCTLAPRREYDWTIHAWRPGLGCLKTAEPIDMPFGGGHIPVGPPKHYYMGCTLATRGE